MSGPSLQVDFPFSFLFLGNFFLEMGGGERRGKNQNLTGGKARKGLPGDGSRPGHKGGAGRALICRAPVTRD